MFDIMLFLIDNIWAVAAIIVIAGLIFLKAFGKTMSTVVKIVLFIFIIAAICLALGLTTGEELKNAAIEFAEGLKNYDFGNYKNGVISSSSADQFIEPKSD